MGLTYDDLSSLILFATFFRKGTCLPGDWKAVSIVASNQTA